MPTVTFKRPERGMTVDQLANLIAIVTKELEWLITGNLDVNNIKANGIEAKNIKAGTITADKMNVDELSAISANLGTITAGLVSAVQIFSSYIATSQAGIYPRIEFSSADNLLNAQGNANESVSIDPSADGTPSVVHEDSSTADRGISFLSDGSYNFTTVPGTDITIFPGADLLLKAVNNVRLQSWAKLYSDVDAEDLQTALDNLTTSINDLSTTVDVLTTTVAGKATLGNPTSTDGLHNHGVPDGTVLMVNGGGTVTFSQSGSHSHTET